MNTKEIIEEFARYWNEQSGVYIRPSHIDDFINSQSPSAEIGQQGKIDFNKLREKYFQECTHKPKDGYIMRQHSLPPHDIFEWFKRQFAASQPTPPQEGQDELDKRAEKILMSMMEENSPKLLQFFLSCLAKQMNSGNVGEMELSCELDIKNERYKIETKSTLIKK